MIIWINGSFGIGKTSTAELLKNELDKSIIYDPEEIGGFLSNMFNHEKDDFQDYDITFFVIDMGEFLKIYVFCL